MHRKVDYKKSSSELGDSIDQLDSNESEDEMIDDSHLEDLLSMLAGEEEIGIEESGCERQVSVPSHFKIGSSRDGDNTLDDQEDGVALMNPKEIQDSWLQTNEQ